MVTAGSRVGQHASDFTPSQSGKMSVSTGQRKDSEEGGGGIYFPYQCCSECFDHSDHIIIEVGVEPPLLLNPKLCCQFNDELYNSEGP